MPLEIPIPRKLVPLLEPKRYKGVHGGRGSSKSHTFAALAVATNYSRPLRGVCIREVQNTIKDSSKQLIEAKIGALGLDAHFDVTRDEVRGSNGSLILFRGMQSFNADNIKSLEGIDWAWIDEAQNLSARSWRLLRPTIRRPNSEIWCSWNPRHDTDAVDEFFRGKGRDGAMQVCIEMNWIDNPWFPDVLRQEREADYAVDSEMAEHVWGGGYEIISEGAYYARWIAAAEREGRVGNFPYNPSLRLRTAWDLGMDDYTAIWFIQDDGNTPTAVDYYECNGTGFDEQIAVAMPEIFVPPSDDISFIGWDRQKALDEFGRDMPFKYDGHFLPHDVKVRELGASGRHRFQTLQRLGMKNVHKGVIGSAEERVGAGRALLPRMRFNASPRVLHGLKRLRNYKKKFNELMGQYEGPKKDGNDHGADAFGEYALNCDLLPRQVVVPKKELPKRIEITRIGPGMVQSNIDPVLGEKLSPDEFIKMIKQSRKQSER